MAPTAKTSAGKKVLRGVDVDERDPMKRVTGFLKFGRERTYEGFDADLLTNHLTLTAATTTPGTTTFSFTVPPAYCNRMGNLHGGAAALIFDICTTAALAPVAKLGYWQFAGVTRTLTVSYLRPAPVGTTVEIHSEVINAGKRLASIRGEIRAGGKVLMTAEHLKAAIDPPITKL